jgi:hypothetical protein
MARSRRLGVAKFLPAFGGNWWLFRDRFSADLAVGNVNGSSAIPGPGLRAVTDVESKIFTTGSRLRGGGQDSPVWGESKVVWTQGDGSGFARSPGRTLAALILFEDTIVDADVAFGWATAADIGDPRTDGHGFLQEGGGALKVITPGTTIQIQTTLQRNVRPMQYLIGVTLGDVGAIVWYTTFGVATGIQMSAFDTPQFPTARILWVEYTDATAALFPYVAYLGKIDAPPAGYPNGNSLEDLRIVDPAEWASADSWAGFADRFAKSDSATSLGNNWTAVLGTWGITGGKAYLATGHPPTAFYRAIHDTGLPDGNGIFQWNITVPDATPAFFGLLFRYQDTDNFFRIFISGINALALQKWVGGSITTIGSNAQTWTAGQTYRITLHAEDGRFKVWVDGSLKIDGTTDDDLNDVTTIGIEILDDGSGRSGLAGHKFDNIAAFPQTFTLPNTIRRGKNPDVLTTGAILAGDSFTDEDGTLLPAHSAESGSAWETDNSDWSIQSNQADPALHNTKQTCCVQDLGVVDAECQADIFYPAGVDDFFYGIVGRYVDSDNWLGARLCEANYSPGAHEVELFYMIEGASNVRHKINLGDFLVDNTTYTLKMQFKGDLIQVFLDGTPVLSYYTIDEDPRGTKFGINADHASRTDDGGTFDNWVAKAL